MAMASYSQVLGLKGSAHWFFVQGQEEMTHALRFYKYVVDQGEHAELAAIAAPQAKFKSLRDMFEQTLKHEKHVTALINNLVNLAKEEKDHATEGFLQWFVKEQVEEEATANDVLASIKLSGENTGGIFLIDKDLGTRVFMPPPDLVIG
jgi:ferritin